MSNAEAALALFQKQVGNEEGVGEWFTVTQEQINQFADATLDHQWIHVDADKAAAGPFGTTIAHGHLTMSLAPALLNEIIDVNAGMLVNPGGDRIRLRTPVRCGDRVRMHAKLKALRKIPGGGVRATVHTSFEIEGEKKPAAFGDMLLVYFP